MFLNMPQDMPANANGWWMQVLSSSHSYTCHVHRMERSAKGGILRTRHEEPWKCERGKADSGNLKGVNATMPLALRWKLAMGVCFIEGTLFELISRET